jgi:AraC family transcriptional regulator
LGCKERFKKRGENRDKSKKPAVLSGFKNNLKMSVLTINPAKMLLDRGGAEQRPLDKPADCAAWTGRDGQISAHHFRSKSDVHYPLHAHSEYTVIVCLAGEIKVQQLGHEQVIGPGEALIGNCGVFQASTYRALNGRGCEAVSISLDRRLMEALTADFEMMNWETATCPAFLGKAQGAVLQDCAQELAKELKGSQAGRKIIIESQAIRLLVETVRLWPRMGIANIQADATQRLTRIEFFRACEFMRGCRKENFRLQFLCRFLGSSEERFTRLFLSSTQQTPASFYNRMLLDRACELLADPALSIKEVGFDLGFKSSSHFIAAFRRQHGVSPQRYRAVPLLEPSAGAFTPQQSPGPVIRFEIRAEREGAGV